MRPTALVLNVVVATIATVRFSAAFILVNSIAGLAGNVESLRSLPASLPLLLGAAVAGGLLGAELGAKRLRPRTLRLLLAAVLLIAGLKLIMSR